MSQSATTLRAFDLDFEGTKMHCWEGGAGTPVVLLHGSGAGCATFSNFGAVIHELANSFRVLAVDLIGFGRSGLRPVQPYFDVEMWMRQAQAAMDYLHEDGVGLVGHSLGGAIALKLAARDPRVAAVLTTGTMGAFEKPDPNGWTWTFPEDRAGIQRHIERTLFDKSLVPDGEVEERARTLFAPGYEEYFRSMFGGDRQRFFDDSALTSYELSSITCPVVLMHGWEDASFSPETSSIPLARAIYRSDLILLSQCGHSVALEHPNKFLAAVRRWFDFTSADRTG